MMSMRAWWPCALVLVVSCVSEPKDLAPAQEEQVAEEDTGFRLFSDPETGVPPTSGQRRSATAAPTRTLAAAAPATGAVARPAGGARSDRRTISDRLGETTLSGFVVRNEESLRTVARLMKQLTGLPLVVLPEAEDAVYDSGIVFDFQFDHELTAFQLLNLISDATDGKVTWVIQHDAILFTTDRMRGQKMIVHAHDIHDLVMPRTDFKGPRIDRIRLLDDLEDEDGGGPFGGSETVTEMTEDEVLSLVQESVQPDAWSLSGARIDAENGQLIVVHTVDMQLRVQKFLDSLR